MMIIKGKYIVSVGVKPKIVIDEKRVEAFILNEAPIKHTKEEAFEKELAGYNEDGNLYIRPRINITTVNGKSEDYFCDKLESDGFDIEDTARSIMSCDYMEIKNKEIVHLQMLVKQS